MIEWRAEGILLSNRPHGEADTIAEVLTRDRGRHAGVIRGGQSRKRAAHLQPGAQLDLKWRARIETHIGSFVAEPIRGRAGALMSDRAALATLKSVTSLIAAAAPERQPMVPLYDRTIALFERMLASGDWPATYVAWEAMLLADLGFGLDLRRCANGGQGPLAFVSPRTGRGVSRDGAGEWADRLLVLPSFLNGGEDASAADVEAGLALTGHFLHQRLAPLLPRPAAIDARDAAARAIVAALSRGAGTPA
ncbi:DNA repair protein RecO [Roseobacter sp. HKCCA0434]|uniref:DNA repair protein RecO n=1 Tax=Roseobacter sp. HKCCA0434 TaxID=3079297 RepID=UPI002905A74A|nr:DNA repair protein RecO [Roseobacter sp. HKCCA0434]